MPQDTQQTEQQGEVYARAPQHIPDAAYLTPGKLYPVTKDDGFGFFSVSDGGLEIYCSWEGCCHLDGGNWERVA